MRDETSLAVVQARMSSTRLPGKTLADIGGEPALALLLKRARRARSIGTVVVATSTDAVDDAIAELARGLGHGVVRGPREDVLARFLLAVTEWDGPVVRLTGDCPLIDPVVIDATIDVYLGTPGCRYASNVEPRTFPDGLDVEVVDAEALRLVSLDALTTADREHVTRAISAQPERFPAAALVADQDLGDLRWTVDEAEDLEFVRLVIDRLGHRRYEAGMQEILASVHQVPSLADFGGACRGR